MRCVAWNIRGIRSRGKSTAIKKVVSEKQLHVCGLVETKHNSSVDRSIRSWWSNTNVEFMEVRSEDRGGGLILMWDANSLRRVSGVCGDRWIMISGSFGDLETQVSIILVYCPCSTESRRRVLEELIGVKRQCNGPALLFGDFNEILNPDERLRQQHITSGMEEFDNWVSNMELIVLPLIERKFTWSNCRSASQIDKAFVTSFGEI
ncbi:uncharacterized protein LOC141613516 [Silene latifolia]|uniref:uncharacterized protein LOC141613516 n=1 Tax=Silene latifolia TaxID=37657 RepID=UPI003D784C40